MPASERTRRALHEFGLTDYEVKAYVALVENGVMQASQVSERSAVPYSKIYEVLLSLERKGWIETEQGRPIRYYPKPPSVALETARMRLEDALKSGIDQSLTELQPLYEKKGVQERPEIWIVRGEYNILSKMKETLQRTRKELQIAVPSIPEGILDLISPIFHPLLDKGVRISIMAAANFPGSALRKLSNLGEVRTRQQMFGGGIISDGSQVLLLLGEEMDRGLVLAISSDHVGLVRYAKNYFDYLWNSPDTERFKL